jgi:predicted enzyme related to lactoylglutathione lyase
VAPHLVDIVDPLGAVCTVDERAGRAPLDHGWARASWFEIMTTDAATTDRFYRSVFDYGIGGPEEASEAAPFAVLAVDGQPVAGRLLLPAELAALLGDRWMTYLAVRDVDAAVAQASQLGAAVLAPPRDAPTGRLSALRDPCGAVFTLLTPAGSD